MSWYDTEWADSTLIISTSVILYINRSSPTYRDHTYGIETVVPETVIVVSYIHLPEAQFAWNTIFLPSAVAVEPPGAVKLNGLPVTAKGAKLLVNGPLTEEAVA